ncbi:hypothetical protein ABH930_000242 [Kitasatospora sp. GAS204A]|nr:hypothetical protein [Kitasatospora sp. GAS204B]
MAWYQGPCRITVTGVEAEWPQRAVVTIRGTGRTIVIPGTEGASEVIEAESWDLALEHRIDGTWFANIRAVQSRWQEVGGVESQLIRSKDRDRPGDRRDRNLTLRVEKTVRGGRAPEAEAVATARASVESSWSARTSTQPARTTTSGGMPVTGGAPTRVNTSGGAGAGEAPARVATAGDDYSAFL